MARILVIEDEAAIREGLRGMLARAGHEVAVAAGGSEGLALQREDPADLIITDILMPGTDGIEIIMEFRRRYPETHVIAISEGVRHRGFDYLAAAQKLGASRAIAKPFQAKEILAAVKELLSRP